MHLYHSSASKCDKSTSRELLKSASSGPDIVQKPDVTRFDVVACVISFGDVG